MSLKTIEEKQFDELCQKAMRFEQLPIQDKMNMHQTLQAYLQVDQQEESIRAKNIYYIMVDQCKEHLINVVKKFEQIEDDQDRLTFLYDQHKKFMETVNQLSVMSYPIRKVVKEDWQKPTILKSAKLIFERKFESNSHLIYKNIVNLMQKYIDEENEKNEGKFEQMKCLINKVGSLLIELHIDNFELLSDEKLSDSNFKKYLLGHFQQLFKDKSKELKGQSVIQYLSQVKQLKRKLSELVKFKKEDILQPLQKLLFQEFLASYKTILLDEKKEDSFQNLIEQKNREGLQLVAELFENLDDHYDKITSAFKTIVLKRGCKILSFYEGKEMDLQIQSQLIDQLSECHLEYQDLINSNFVGQKQSSDFLIALNNAFEEIIDMKIDNYEIPSFLVNLINDNLEKKQLQIIDRVPITQSLQQQQPQTDCNVKLMKLFMFIGNKERFFELYQNSLSERIIKFSRKGLIQHMYLEEENQLKSIEEKCGNQQSESLRNMLKDLQLEKIDSVKDFLITPLIISQQYWPKLPTNQYRLDDKRICDSRVRLEQFVSDNRKKIQWLDDLSTLEIWDRETGQTYFMTIPQYLILNQFNMNMKLLMHQIQKTTKLDKEAILQNIAILINNKIIRVENNVYLLNQPALEKKQMILKKPLEPIYLDIVFPERQINKDLGQMNMDVAVEAWIVKVMKVRKQMKYQDLVDEVKFNMRKFNIDQNLIKQLTEKLSKNGYLERDSLDINIFKFI